MGLEPAPIEEIAAWKITCCQCYTELTIEYYSDTVVRLKFRKRYWHEVKKQDALELEWICPTCYPQQARMDCEGGCGT